MANNKMNIEGKNYSDIPVWRRYTLTIEEAAQILSYRRRKIEDAY